MRIEDLSSNESFEKSLAEILTYSQIFTLELKNLNLSASIDTSAEDDDDGSSTILKNSSKMQNEDVNLMYES